jgi:hypothetical protein
VEGGVTVNGVLFGDDENPIFWNYIEVVVIQHCGIIYEMP